MAYQGLPSHTPQQFVRKGRAAPAGRVLVAAGDSLTEGTFSADYASILRSHLKQARYEVVNAGVNGATSQDLLKRLPGIEQCQPDVVTVLIGTNDLLLDSPAQYQRNLRTIITSLRFKTHAAIALISLPPHGEDLTSKGNREVQSANQVIQDLASASHVEYIPLYEAMAACIRQAGERNGPAPTRLVDIHENLSTQAALRRFFLYQSWDTISKANGFYLLTDGIHMNGRAAGLAADLIERWVRTLP